MHSNTNSYLSADKKNFPERAVVSAIGARTRPPGRPMPHPPGDGTVRLPEGRPPQASADRLRPLDRGAEDERLLTRARTRSCRHRESPGPVLCCPGGWRPKGVNCPGSRAPPREGGSACRRRTELLLTRAQDAATA